MGYKMVHTAELLYIPIKKVTLNSCLMSFSFFDFSGWIWNFFLYESDGNYILSILSCVNGKNVLNIIFTHIFSQIVVLSSLFLYVCRIENVFKNAIKAIQLRRPLGNKKTKLS